MYAVLTGKMTAAAGRVTLPVNATAKVVWGFSFTEILEVLMREALELGQEYRKDLQQAARAAVDALVAFDLPFIPSTIENTLDEVVKQSGYTAIDSVLNALLGPAD